MMKAWQSVLKYLATAILAGSVIGGLAGCDQHRKEPVNQITVGTISGPETALMKVAQNVALENYGLKVKIVEFTDYTLPNRALADGSIDINMFQHLPYLQAAVKADGYDLVPVAKTYIYPVGIYSDKFQKLSDLPRHAIVAIPNDPSNEARALLLLQTAQLVKLKPNAGALATPNDIIANPLNLQIKELDAAQLPRVLADVDVAVINSNYAIAAGLNPTVGDLGSKKDAIFLENKDSLYANLFVVRGADKDRPQVHELIAAFQSPQVQTAAQTIFHHTAIQAW